MRTVYSEAYDQEGDALYRDVLVRTTVYTEGYDQQGNPFYRDVPVSMRTTLYTAPSE
jgi:hypothetical protein